jgi:PHD/YefM family antitoxin component YafN of YafNO toxin-antitoxin module
MKEFSSADLARNVAAVTDAAARAPVAITVYRKPKFVLMAIEDYHALTADRRRVHAIDEMPEEDRARLVDALEALAADEG